MGKHKPIYDPSTDCGDYVVVTGCSDLHVTGKKRQQKVYYSHSTRPGSLKEISLEKMMAKWGGGEILRRAVRGMLPKNRLKDDRLARLKCKYWSRWDVPHVPADFGTFAGFEGEAHPYKDNIFKSMEKPSIADMAEVQATLQTTTAAQSPQ